MEVMWYLLMINSLIPLAWFPLDKESYYDWWAYSNSFIIEKVISVYIKLHPKTGPYNVQNQTCWQPQSLWCWSKSKTFWSAFKLNEPTHFLMSICMTDKNRSIIYLSHPVIWCCVFSNIIFGSMIQCLILKSTFVSKGTTDIHVCARCTHSCCIL